MGRCWHQTRITRIKGLTGVCHKMFMNRSVWMVDVLCEFLTGQLGLQHTGYILINYSRENSHAEVIAGWLQVSVLRDAYTRDVDSTKGIIAELKSELSEANQRDAETSFRMVEVVGRLNEATERASVMERSAVLCSLQL